MGDRKGVEARGAEGAPASREALSVRRAASWSRKARAAVRVARVKTAPRGPSSRSRSTGAARGGPLRAGVAGIDPVGATRLDSELVQPLLDGGESVESEGPACRCHRAPCRRGVPLPIPVLT